LEFLARTNEKFNQNDELAGVPFLDKSAMVIVPLESAPNMHSILTGLIILATLQCLYVYCVKTQTPQICGLLLRFTLAS